VRRGAASCRAVLRSRPGHRGRCRHRGAVIGCRAPQTLQPERGLAVQPAVALVVAVEDVRTPATPFVTLSASSVRPADVGPTGRADVRCPGDQWPRDACDPGVRTDRRPVSAAAASALSAPRWIPDVGAAGQATSGAPGSTGRCGLRAAGSSLPESGLAGRDCRPWPCAARTRVDGTPGPPLRIRTGWAPGSPPGRPRELVQRQGAGGLAGEHGKEQVCSQVPRRCVLGRLPV
jgi:hypothetical protein